MHKQRQKKQHVKKKKKVALLTFKNPGKTLMENVSLDVILFSSPLLASFLYFR